MKVDVLIIGGSLAGAACVRELTRVGVEAVAFDRARFPRGKVCGGFLSPNAVECVDRLGMLDQLKKAGAAAVDHARIRVDGELIEIPFPRTGLGISRTVLDAILVSGAAVQEGIQVHGVHAADSGFVVDSTAGTVHARIVIDAAGKLSRFTPGVAEPEFGVQYVDPSERGSALDFWFFDDGYGGAVTIEGKQSNFCFLIKKEALPRYVSKPGILVTGPLAYDRTPGLAIAIGDAAGMSDPFCGEGMHHALDSAMLAAAVVAKGLADGRECAEIRQSYEQEWARRWAAKRLLVGTIRRAARSPRAVRLALSAKPGWFLDRLWSTIDS